jgi:hypothetical protein
LAKEKDIYLVAYYYMKPRPGVNTAKAGWMNDKANLRYDERVEVTRGLKKDTYAANILLNLSKKTVERNRFNEDRDFKNLFKYFFGGYHQYITQVMTQLDPDYLKLVLDELEAEMKAAEAEEKKDEAVPAE